MKGNHRKKTVNGMPMKAVKALLKSKNPKTKHLREYWRKRLDM